MNRQRGFGSLIMLAIYAVAAAAVLAFVYAAWGGFKDSIGRPYAEAQRKADQVTVDKAVAAQKAAEAREKAADIEITNAKADTTACHAVSDTQTKEVRRWKAAADKSASDAREARAQAQREASAAAPRIADLQAKAAAAPKLMACEEELGKAKAVLRDSLRLRQSPGVTK